MARIAEIRAGCHDAPRHNHDKFLTGKRLAGWHRTRMPPGGAAAWRKWKLVEVRLRRFGVFGHFGVDDFAERIGV